MNSKLNDLKNNASAKKNLLGQAPNTNQKIKKTGKKVPSEITSVNQILKANKTNLAEGWEDINAEVNVEPVRQFALQDALTGLPKRALFEQGFANELIQAKRNGRSLAVLFINIDKFKSINDSYGHGIGDQVLLTVANRLKSFVRGEDLVSRWVGDEFVCVLLEVKHEADVARFAHQLANRIAEPCDFSGTVLTITSSIGISIYPAHGETADILFKNADIAMYKAKETKKRVVVFRTEASPVTGAYELNKKGINVRSTREDSDGQI